MWPARHLAIVSALAAWPAFALDDAGANKAAMSDAAIREAIVADSIAGYPGNCACPFSTMRNGRRCGGRSAYSRKGGRAPLCYPEEVTADMIARFRENRL